MLFDCHLVKSLTHTLTNVVFPEKWKSEKLYSVFRCGGYCRIDNCRPLSLLYGLSEIFEMFISNVGRAQENIISIFHADSGTLVLFIIKKTIPSTIIINSMKEYE